MAKHKDQRAIFSFRQLLHKRFSYPKHLESRSQTVRQLYAKYKNRMDQPKLTVNNLVRAMRYIKAHHVNERDYDKVIQNHTSHESTLFVSDLFNMYDIIAEKVDAKDRITNRKIDDIYNWILQTIIRIVNHGGSICLRGFGTFKGRIVKARKYTVPNKKHRHSSIGKHMTIHFYPSHSWSRALREDTRDDNK